VEEKFYCDSLTPEEISQGWHHCYSWNGKLIGPGFPEMNSCECKVNKVIHNQIKKNEVKLLRKEDLISFRSS
jgi:hypothetical protein